MSSEKIWNFGIPKMGKPYGYFWKFGGVFSEFSRIFSDRSTGKRCAIKGFEKTAINSWSDPVFDPAGRSRNVSRGRKFDDITTVSGEEMPSLFVKILE